MYSLTSKPAIDIDQNKYLCNNNIALYGGVIMWSIENRSNLRWTHHWLSYIKLPRDCRDQQQDVDKFDSQWFSVLCVWTQQMFTALDWCRADNLERLAHLTPPTHNVWLGALNIMSLWGNSMHRCTMGEHVGVTKKKYDIFYLLKILHAFHGTGMKRQHGMVELDDSTLH